MYIYIYVYIIKTDIKKDILNNDYYIVIFVILKIIGIYLG